jgi:hypothetical protein
MRSSWLCRVVALAAVIPPFAHAQAPKITPSGDPSVRNDTIYALAVDSTQHRDERFVYLLDDGVIRLEPDGTSRQTYRQVIQVLTPQAAKAWAERTFSYEPDRERFTLNWLRVLRPSGEVVSTKPGVLQESDVPADDDTPVYVRRRVIRASLSGVAPGMLIDWSATTETTNPILRGNYFSAWSTTTGAFTRRSRLVLDVPKGYTPKIIEINLPRPREETDAGGRHVYRWTAQDLPRAPRPEPFAADSGGWYAGLRIAAPMTWDRIAGWYSVLAADRARLTPALEAKLAELVRNAPTLDDSVRAVHRWVAQDIRYVAVELGIGGFQPRAAAEVLASGFGDCKDKATLFITLARRLGVQAYPVLLYAGSTRQSTPPPPALEAFNHAIAAIARPRGYQYLDLTAELTPFDELPPSDQGQFGLVIHPDRGEPVTLPLAPPRANRFATVVSGTVNDSGFAHARLEITATGAMQYALRAAAAERQDSATWAATTRQLATVLPFARSDSVESFNGKDLTAPARISFVVDGGKLFTVSGTTAVLPVQGLGARAVHELAELSAAGPRQYPIDIAKVNPPISIESEFRFELPAGWQATLPADVHVRGPFGSYSVEYRQTGRHLTIKRVVEGATGILGPDRLGDLVEWFRALARDDATAIVLTRGATQAGR